SVVPVGGTLLVYSSRSWEITSQNAVGTEVFNSGASVPPAQASSFVIVTVPEPEMSTAKDVPDKFDSVIITVSSASTLVSAVGATENVWVSPAFPEKVSTSPATAV